MEVYNHLKDCAPLSKYIDAFAGEWYNMNKILSYNRPNMIITGPRSTGKSTAVAGFALIYRAKLGGRFLYVRRRQNEVDLTKTTFFNDAINIINECHSKYDWWEFKIVYFDCVGNDYHMALEIDGQHYDLPIYDKEGNVKEETEEEHQARLDKETKQRATLAGRNVPLSLAGLIKSGFFVFDDGDCIDNIIFDEFIAEDQIGYLGSVDTPDTEYKKLMSLYVSCDRKLGVARRNEVRLFMLGNMANAYNPVLLKWNINTYIMAAENFRFIAPKDKIWIVEQPEPGKAARDELVHSFQWYMMDESERNYNFNNVARSGYYGNSFVKSKMAPGAEYLSGIIIGGVKYGVYFDKDMYYYIGDWKQHGISEALDIVSYSNGDANILVTHWKDSPTLATIYQAFLMKKLYFKSQKIQRTFLQYLEFIPPS